MFFKMFEGFSCQLVVIYFVNCAASTSRKLMEFKCDEPLFQQRVQQEEPDLT